MKNIDAIQQCTEEKTLLKSALFITGTIKNLSRLTAISPATLTRIAKGTHKGTYATRMRLSAFIDKNLHRPGRPFKKEENINARRNPKIEIGGAN